MGLLYTIGRSVLIMFVYIITCDCCPNLCKCTNVRSRTPDRIRLGQRVTCTMTDISSVTDFGLEEMPQDTIYLILKENRLVTIEYGVFSSLPGLVRLDLSRNLITKIQEGAFRNLSVVEKLDLSHNKLASLSADMFESLNSLQRLILEHNSISRLPKTVFDHMSSLRMIDLSSNPLICDCQLRWFVEWMRSSNIKITQETICLFPLKLKGTSISQLSKKDLHCNWPVQLPLFELKPTVNQLVFEGDSLIFRCRVSNVEDNIQLIWMLDGLVITSDPLGPISVYTHTSTDGSILLSSLSINRLHTHHSGFWKCQVETPRGNESRSVRVIVIAENNQMCPRTTTSDNKGQYIWPETLASITVELQCTSVLTGALGYVPAYAYHTCNSQGVWENLDTSSCPYISEVTKVLEQFAKTNLSLSKTNVLDSARGLRNYTGNGSMLKDKMDIVFIARTIENYMEFVVHHKEVGEILIDVINTIMSVDKKLLHVAQAEDNSCSRLVRSLELLSDLLVDSALNRNRGNIAIEEFFAKSEGFHGMTCTSYTRYAKNDELRFKGSTENLHSDKILHCNNINLTNLPTVINKDKKIEAFIQLPTSLFQQQEFSSVRNLRHKLQFIFYHSSVLFPRLVNSDNSREVTSSVISSKVALTSLQNLTDPVVVMLQAPVYTPDITPAWWNYNTINGQGDWSEDGCKILKVQDNLVTFSCNRLSTYGLLQDLDALSLQLGLQQAQFRSSHPAIYIGSLICIGALSATIGIYCCSFKKLKMPNKNKHSLINTWIAMTMLCIVFCFGILQTDYNKVCQGIGLVLHYLTFCTLFWMIIIASNLYKKLTKTEPPELLPDEPFPDQLLPPKPMLRFYLVGWGISTIVCGISAAVHVENYAGRHYCFLSFNPSLVAFYGPAAILMFFLTVFFLLIYCVLHENNKITAMAGMPLCDNIPIADNVVMELTHTNHEEGSVHSADKNSDNIEDIEYSYQTQLRAHVIVFLLFLFAWASGAMAVGRPFIDNLPADDLIFSLLYCLFTILIGAFIFSFFCYYRQDVQQCLKMWKEKRKELTVKQETARESQSSEILNSTNTSLQDGHINVSLSHQGSDKLTNCNLLSSHPSSVTEHSFNGAEMFYDPRQSVVARKFFEKNRRQQQLKLLQKNNLQKEAAIFCDENKTDTNGQKNESDHVSINSATCAQESTKSSQKQCNISHNAKENLDEHNCANDDSVIRNRYKTFPYSGNPAMKLEKRSSLSKLPERNVELYPKDTSPASSGSLHGHHHQLSLPHWTISSRTCSNHKDSCAECSDCSQKPPSIISNNCFSDLTECNLAHITNNKHRPRSRSRGNHWRKNRRQHSWDGRCKNDNKNNRHYSQSTHSNRAYQVSLSNKKNCRKQVKPSYFPRSQSAYEQSKNVTLESLSGGDSEYLQQQREVCM